MMIARELERRHKRQTNKPNNNNRSPESRNAPSEHSPVPSHPVQSIAFVREHLFALVVDTLILVVLGKKGQQRSERSRARSKYEWAEQRPDEEWFKQDKPVGPGLKTERQQRKLDKNRNTQIQYKSNNKQTWPKIVIVRVRSCHDFE